MAGQARRDLGPRIRLEKGPRDRWEYHQTEFLDCVRAAQIMARLHSRPIDHPASWPLSYARPVTGTVWKWHEGVNCHPKPIAWDDGSLPWDGGSESSPAA